MKNFINKNKIPCFVWLIFFVSAPAFGEVKAPLNVRYAYEKIKGIPWENATEATQKDFLDQYNRSGGKFPQQTSKTKATGQQLEEVPVKKKSTEVQQERIVPLRIRYGFEKQTGKDWYSATKEEQDKFLGKVEKEDLKTKMAGQKAERTKEQVAAREQLDETRQKNSEIKKEAVRELSEQRKKIALAKKRTSLGISVDKMQTKAARSHKR